MTIVGSIFNIRTSTIATAEPLADVYGFALPLGSLVSNLPGTWVVGRQHLINTAHHRFIRVPLWVNRLSPVGTRWAVSCFCAEIHFRTDRLCQMCLRTCDRGYNFRLLLMRVWCCWSDPCTCRGSHRVHSRTIPSLSTSLTLLLRVGFTFFVFRTTSRKAWPVHVDLLTWNNQNKNRKDSPSSLGRSF